MIFPTGDLHGKYMAKNQPATMAAMEGLFNTETGAAMVIMGQPNEETADHRQPARRQQSPELSDLRNDASRGTGLDNSRATNGRHLPAALLRYHIMAGLGTYFVALMCWRLSLWRENFRLALDSLASALSFPLPYIANTAGWMTAEIGRQPWLVYGLMRTSDGYSKNVSAGNTLFTLLGFMGMYAVLRFCSSSWCTAKSVRSVQRRSISCDRTLATR